MRRWLARRRDNEAPDLATWHEAPTLPDGLADRIERVEQAALSLYARHGLPTQAGGYLRRGPDAPWEKLSDTLTPEEKWQLLEQAPPGAGWRFADRSALGRNHPEPRVHRAAILLAACGGLRARLDGHIPTTAQDLADAVQLGAASAWLTGGETKAPSTPDDNRP